MTVRSSGPGALSSATERIPPRSKVPSAWMSTERTAPPGPRSTPVGHAAPGLRPPSPSSGCPNRRGGELHRRAVAAGASLDGQRRCSPPMVTWMRPSPTSAPTRWWSWSTWVRSTVVELAVGGRRQVGRVVAAADRHQSHAGQSDRGTASGRRTGLRGGTLSAITATPYIPTWHRIGAMVRPSGAADRCCRSGAVDQVHQGDRVGHERASPEQSSPSSSSGTHSVATTSPSSKVTGPSQLTVQIPGELRHVRRRG